MATNAMVPYSNPGGRNQTSPPVVGAAPIGNIASTGTLSAPGAAATANPLIPAGAGATTGAPAVPSALGTGTGSSAPNGDLSKQLTDIYGNGTGGALSTLLGNMSGTDSAILQEYINSLQPQEATAKANLDASLGAGGVSANSSVAALGNANLQAQETGMIAGEEATLTQSQEELTAQVLESTEQASATETAESGWNVFGQVVGAVGGLAKDAAPFFVQPAGSQI